MLEVTGINAVLVDGKKLTLETFVSSNPKNLLELPAALTGWFNKFSEAQVKACEALKAQITQLEAQCDVLTAEKLAAEKRLDVIAEGYKAQIQNLASDLQLQVQLNNFHMQMQGLLLQAGKTDTAIALYKEIRRIENLRARAALDAESL